MDELNKIKERARAAYKDAELDKNESDRNLMRSRHELDSAEAAFVQAQEDYRQAKALNEQASVSLKQAKAEFVEVFGEQP